MKTGIVGAAIKSLGATPIVSFDRSALKAEKLEQPKKLPALVLSDGTKSERFVLEPQAIDQVIAALA